MKKLLSVFCIFALLISSIAFNPVEVNAALTTSDVVPTVTEYPSKKLEVIPGMEKVTIYTHANNGDYILAIGYYNGNRDDSYLFVLDEGKLIKKHLLDDLIKQTTLINYSDEIKSYGFVRVQYFNNRFYILLTGIEYIYEPDSKYHNILCDALVTKDGLKFTTQSMPTVKLLKSMEYYPCSLISKMGDYYIYTTDSVIMPDENGRMTYYTSKNLKTWTKRTTIKTNLSTTGKYKYNDIIWSIAAVTDEGVYFQATSRGWFGSTTNSYVETYYTSDFKTYKKASGFTVKKNALIDLSSLPSYSTNAVVGIQRTVDWKNWSSTESDCTLFIATSLGKFKEKLQFSTDGGYNWIYGDDKTFVVTAKSGGNSYIFRSTDKGANFTQHQLGDLSADEIELNKLLFSTDKGAYIGYGVSSIITTKDAFLTIKMVTFDSNVLASLSTDTANYIITEAGLCRLTDKELDGLFK